MKDITLVRDDLPFFSIYIDSAGGCQINDFLGGGLFRVLSAIQPIDLSVFRGVPATQKIYYAIKAAVESWLTDFVRMGVLYQNPFDHRWTVTYVP